jgi:hypothetical protein
MAALLLFYNERMIILINSVNAATQTVPAGQNVTFATDRVRTNSCNSCCGGWLSHDLGSGLFTITKPGIYEVGFNANVTNATTVGLIVLDVTNSGETIAGSEMVATPAAVTTYVNVSSNILVRVPCNSSVTISVKNNSAAAILVSQANLFITREC